MKDLQQLISFEHLLNDAAEKLVICSIAQGFRYDPRLSGQMI